MDTSLEEEEAKIINLYCSDYIRESIDSASYLREQFKASLAAKTSNGALTDTQGTQPANNSVNSSTLACSTSTAEKD